MAGRFDRGVTVNDKPRERVGMAEKRFANPHHVFRRLIGQRHAGANACVNEQKSVFLMPKLQTRQKIAVGSWDRGAGVPQNVGHVAPLGVHTIAGHGGLPAKTRGKP